MRNPSYESGVRATDCSGPAHKTAWLAVLFGLAAVAGLQATVLDNFTGPKTGWTDTLNGGAVLQSGGQFTVTTANPGGSLTYSKKTSSSFTNVSGHSLEFRVNVDSVTPGTANTNPLAILAWVPAGGAVLANGYSISVGAADVLIQKGGTTLYATNFTAAGTNLQNANITIALRMSSSGSAVTVNARVYKRIGNGIIGQYFTTLFEYTVVDSAGLIGGTGGNAALGVKNQASASGAAAAFSNLQVFDTITTVLDTFSGGTLDTTKWTVYRKNAGLGDSVTVGPGGLDILATIADKSGGFAALYSANTTYKIVDGGQVEFQLDIVNNLTGDANGYSALGYLPAANPTYINGIIEYHVAHDIIGHTVVVNGKGYNEWWGGRNDIQPPYTPPGCRYILTMTGEGANCRVETRIEDLSVADVNDPARLVWQTEFVDTPAADPSLNEDIVGNPAPYLNSPDGRFAISTFNAGAVPVAFGGTSPNWAEVIYSNAVVRQTPPGKSAPILANVSPAYAANFLPTANVVSFDASDDTILPLNGISVTLNGVTYSNGSPGVTITPGGSTSTTRHFALANALTANVNYVGSVQATDADGLSASFPLVFDTFLTNDYMIEAEEFNFSTNGGISGGAFIDNPRLIVDGGTDPNAYNSQPGLAGVDYHDNRGPWSGIQDANHTFRWNDSVYTSHSSDPARAKYANAGGIPSGYYETEVTDIYDGDWLNYTHAYPAGTYNVFLRQATFKLLGSLVTLERVTSDPTAVDQTASVLGSFLGIPTGIGLFVNVPLTDGTGNSNLVLRFSGSQDTLRLMNRVTGNADLDVGTLEQNYLVLVPVADPGTLRPVVSMVSPAPNAKLGANAPNTGASIANRDTFVDMSTIALTINGIGVPISDLVSNLNGISFTWTPTGLPGSLALTNTVTFKDSAGVQQSFTWTYSYASILNASASLPVGSLSVRGFDARMVQSSAANMSGSGGLNNSVASAQTVLAIPPTYAVDLTSTNFVQTVAWDLNPPGGYGATANFPGLCQPPAVGSSFAIETLAYLQLSAGPHRMSVDSDDAVGIYSGANLADTSIALVENNGTTHTSFDFYAPVDGLYPFHVIYQQGGGSAVLVLKSLEGGTTNLLNVAGGVNAYYPFVCKSSTSAAGPYTVDAAANAGNVLTTADVLCDGTGTALNQTVTGGTLTIPIAGSAKFYRLNGPRPSMITGITKSGSNVVITYQAQ